MAATNMRRIGAIRHIVMGLILIGFAWAVVHFHAFGQIDLSASTSYVLAGVMTVYGLFRIYRGTREMRERNVDDFIS